MKPLRSLSLALLALLFASCGGKKESSNADITPEVQKFYAERNNEIAWTRDGKPTAQANAFIQFMLSPAIQKVMATGAGFGPANVTVISRTVSRVESVLDLKRINPPMPNTTTPTTVPYSRTATPIIAPMTAYMTYTCGMSASSSRSIVRLVEG